MITEELKTQLVKFLKDNKKITVLTGAGISAESGIPTYRGVEGYWTKGSRNYKPEEIGTFYFFEREPEEVWQFSLYRRAVCKNASPNKGHYAIVELEKLFKDRFTLITQNVDGLHLRAGNSYERTCQIHGDIDFIRCSDECEGKLLDFPNGVKGKRLDEKVTKEEMDLLTCPNCGSLCRPNVLWFDEYYNERYYKAETAIRTAGKTGLLIIVGTMGATSLPRQIFNEVDMKQQLIIDVNIDDNPFSQRLDHRKHGFVLRGKSGEILPKLVEEIKRLF